MRIIFIADLHLSKDKPRLLDLFSHFLTQNALDADQLYILGDLFEVWIGDDFVLPELQPIVKLLKHLSLTRPVYFMHGNRDFLIGNGFEELSGCKILPDPYIIDLFGSKTLLSHGDMFCTDDIEYQKFRTAVRTPKWIENVLSKSVEERLIYANHIRSESQKMSSMKSEDIMDVNENSVETIMRQWQVLHLIHGHTHRPKQHHFMLDNLPATRIVLGDWQESAKVLVCDEKSCRLETYPS